MSFEMLTWESSHSVRSETSGRMSNSFSASGLEDLSVTPVTRKTAMQRILNELVFTVVALIFSYQAAQAAPITIICTNPYQPNQVPFTIDLDQVENTVTIRNPGNSTKYRATFDAKTIKFNTGDWAYTIDRLTGTTTASGAGGVVMNFPCHVGKVQF